MEAGKKAVVLSSGGLDSTTVMAIAVEEGFDVYSLTVDYGQRHRVELEAARRVAKALGAEEHKVLQVDLAGIGGSALTDNLKVPKGRSEEEIPNTIPVTYVPARNTVFLSLALAWAEVLGAAHIFVGVNSVDYSGYPDCRPEFLAAFEKMAGLATKAGVEGRLRIRIHAPLSRMSKREIILKGLELGVDYGLTHSCYDPLPDGRPCGECDSCRLRRKGFREAGIQDPVEGQAAAPWG